MFVCQMFSQIIPEAPGHCWILQQNGEWMMDWKPITNIYSPPRLLAGVWRLDIPMDSTLMGSTIGIQGQHFKNITHWSQCLYIYYKDDHVEIWGTGHFPFIARDLILRHRQSILAKYGQKQVV